MVMTREQLKKRRLRFYGLLRYLGMCRSNIISSKWWIIEIITAGINRQKRIQLCSVGFGEHNYFQFCERKFENLVKLGFPIFVSNRTEDRALTLSLTADDATHCVKRFLSKIPWNFNSFHQNGIHQINKLFANNCDNSSLISRQNPTIAILIIPQTVMCSSHNLSFRKLIRKII